MKRIRFFASYIKPGDKILDVGCSFGWARSSLKQIGIANYTGLDIAPPADIVGDINDWKNLGLEAASFDVILAFEVVEHVDCFQACYDLLRPGGRMLITTPLPERDWILKIMENIGLNQKRTSPHINLVNLDKINIFNKKNVFIVMGLAQWAVFYK